MEQLVLDRRSESAQWTKKTSIFSLISNFLLISDNGIVVDSFIAICLVDSNIFQSELRVHLLIDELCFKAVWRHYLFLELAQ